MTVDHLDRIVILGGGTAGWMAAAAFGRNVARQTKVTLVESADIGTIGVGEATVPSIRQFNQLLNIPEGDFMKATKATLKLGIQFNDWRRKGHSYFHPFGVYGTGPELGQFHQAWLTLVQAGLLDPDGADELSAYSQCAHAALQNKATIQDPNPASPYSRLNSAYHFDAGLYAAYMRQLAEAAGVTRIEGEVTRVETDPDSGFVRSLVLKSGEMVEGNLFIDCSGFRSLLLGQTLETPWLDWSHWLPMDRAWAVPSEHGGPRKPYTMSTAQEAGWTWQIPLQHRVGNGHVFASQWMDEDRARDVLLAALPGKPLADPRLIRFRTGRFEKTWVKNVVGIGLATGFIEPLESTSIYFIQSAIQKLLNHLPDKRFAPVNTEVFNQRMDEDYAVVRDVIIMHYCLTERDDAGLWDHVRTMDIPDSLRQRLDIFADRGMLINRPEETFMSSSWLAILVGQGPLPRSHSPLLDGPPLEGMRDMVRGMRDQIAAWVRPLPSQDDLLRHHGLIP